jgi:hypothetical protein
MQPIHLRGDVGAHLSKKMDRMSVHSSTVSVPPTLVRNTMEAESSGATAISTAPAKPVAMSCTESSASSVSVQLAGRTAPC